MKEEAKLLKQLKSVANSGTEVSVIIENQRGGIFVRTGSLELTPEGSFMVFINKHIRAQIHIKEVLALSILDRVWEAKCLK